MKSETPDNRRARLEQLDKNFFEECRKTEALNMQKTARLKALRLANAQEGFQPSESVHRPSKLSGRDERIS